MRRILRGRVHSAVSLRTHPDVVRAFGVTVEQDGAAVAASAVATESPNATTTGSQVPAQRARFRTGFPNRLPDPTSRRDLEYYRDSTRRGYLAHEVPEGDSPSLYFKTPMQRQRETNEARAERRRRRTVAGPVGTAVQKRSIRPGERIKLW
jgi:large subunit ribosomal protein L15